MGRISPHLSGLNFKQILSLPNKTCLWATCGPSARVLIVYTGLMISSQRRWPCCDRWLRLTPVDSFSSPSLHQSGEAGLGCGIDPKISVALNSKGLFLAHITCPLWDYFTTWATGCCPPHSWPRSLMGLTIQGLISSKCWHYWGLVKRRTSFAQALKGFCFYLIGQSKSRELGTLKGSPMLSGRRTENICL